MLQLHYFCVIFSLCFSATIAQLLHSEASNDKNAGTRYKWVPFAGRTWLRECKIRTTNSDKGLISSLSFKCHNSEIRFLWMIFGALSLLYMCSKICCWFSGFFFSTISIVYVIRFSVSSPPSSAFFCSPDSRMFLIFNDSVRRIAFYHHWLGKLWTFQ